MRTKSVFRVIIAVVLLVLVLIPVVFATMSFFAKRPDNLGIHDGHLAACPDKPNCVCSDVDDPAHEIEPIRYSGSVDEAIGRLRKVLGEQPRTTIVTEDGNYIHAECRSLIFRFVDDVEFYVDPEAGVIQVRSASRSGHSDFGVNRSRVETIRAEFDQQSPAGTPADDAT